MKKRAAIKHFGTVKALADALGIWPQAVYKWKEDVPEHSAYRIQEITKGELKK